MNPVKMREEVAHLAKGGGGGGREKNGESKTFPRRLERGSINVVLCAAAHS